MVCRLRLPVALCALTLAVSLTGCSSDSTSPADHGEPPTLPPAASMQADPSLFDAASASVGGVEADVVGSNFLAAAITVSVARAATIVVMEVPVWTFVAVASNTPIYQDGAFHWIYSATPNGQPYVLRADLPGVAQGSQSLWEMRISLASTTPPINDFLWYDGNANLDGTAGAWHIYDAGNPSSSTEVLGITWTHESANTWSLIFSNVNPAAAELGDQLSYLSAGDERTVQFLDASASTRTTIEWNDTTHAGYIESPAYNGGVRSCWDGTFQDTTCGS